MKEGRGSCRVGVVVEVGGQKVVRHRLKAELEERRLYLRVGEVVEEPVAVMQEVVQFGLEEGCSKSRAADGLAQDSDTRGKFSIVGKHVKGSTSGGVKVGGEDRRRPCGRGKELGLSESRADTMGGAEFVEAAEKKGNVLERKANLRVIGVGHGCTGSFVGATGKLQGGEFLLERAEDFKEDKAGEDGAQGASLGVPG
jgi:hypothetical protein